MVRGKTLFLCITGIIFLFLMQGLSDAYTFSTNSVGALSTIKITEMSGSLPVSGAAITVSAWDASGNALTQSASAPTLMLYNYGTTYIAGTDLAARFPTGTPMLYSFIINSPMTVITNVKQSQNGSFNFPITFTNGLHHFTVNTVGPLSTVKITDMSGSLGSQGSIITVSAWDGYGNELTQSAGATPPLLYSFGTTTITGTALAALFQGAPVTYQFEVASSQCIFTNFKWSADGTISVPIVFTSGITNYSTNSVGPLSTLKITDMSGSLPDSGAVITIGAWDAGGNALVESTNAAPLIAVYNYGTTTIKGTDLAARFTGGIPAAYAFTVGSTQYIITNVTSSTDGSINIPTVFTNGTNNFITNSVDPGDTIKITDLNGLLGSSGAVITVSAWDDQGNVFSGSASPLVLYSYGTTTITGSALAAPYPNGAPAAYAFSVASPNYLITTVKSTAGGILHIPNIVYGVSSVGDPKAVSTIAGTAGAPGSADGTGAAARFNLPDSITTDGANLYVADTNNSTIRKIVISTGAVTTLAGTAGAPGPTDGTGAAARFNGPYGITTDGTNLYVADTNNSTIRKIVISTGAVTTLAGTAGASGSTDGTGAAARFKNPYGITTDRTNLYVADTYNNTIRTIVISTGAVTTLAGMALARGSADGTSSATGSTARFFFPEGITTDGTNLYVADTYNHTIRKIVISTGTVTTLAGTAGAPGSTDGTGAAARFKNPYGITTDVGITTNGYNLYVADTNNSTIRKIQ